MAVEKLGFPKVCGPLYEGSRYFRSVGLGGPDFWKTAAKSDKFGGCPAIIDHDFGFRL